MLITLIAYPEMDLPNELDLIESFIEALETSLNGRKPHFLGHNIPFDLKFLYRRCVILGIKTKIKFPFRGRHGVDYFDNSQEWCDYKEYISQDKLCKLLGIEGKPKDIDGSKVWDFYKAGNIERIAEYNQDDVMKVFQIYERLTR